MSFENNPEYDDIASAEIYDAWLEVMCICVLAKTGYDRAKALKLSEEDCLRASVVNLAHTILTTSEGE